MTPSGTTRLAEATPTIQRAIRRSCDLSGIANSQSRIADINCAADGGKRTHAPPIACLCRGARTQA
jgi:hypothetical protein